MATHYIIKVKLISLWNGHNVLDTSMIKIVYIPCQINRMYKKINRTEKIKIIENKIIHRIKYRIINRK